MGCPLKALTVKLCVRKRKDATMRKKRWEPASHPAWLTEEAYRQKVQPLLNRISTSGIATALTVTWAYAANLRKEKCLPYGRHWLNVGATCRGIF